jgi:hypothetical protein
MQMTRLRGVSLFLTAALGTIFFRPLTAESACCYFSAKDQDVQQPGQKVFITWDPARHRETFTVQPKFEGNAKDFGMVIPTPGKPKLDEMPRDFFREMAVYTILRQRQFPESRLLARQIGWGGLGMAGGMMGMAGGMMGMGGAFGGMGAPRQPPVKVLESGIVGSLDYKIITARRADSLYDWLKDHQYHYSGDEATLDHYVKKQWYFTVMKIDTMQMKKNKDGSYEGEVTPTRFQFTTEKLIYPLKITQLSVKDRTEALFYIQTPYKVDLPGDFTYQYQWISLLQNAQGWYQKGVFGPKSLPGGGDDWLQAIRGQSQDLLKKADELGFAFASGQRPQAGRDGRTPTTLEWARRLTASDIRILIGQAPYSEKVPDVDAGFTMADIKIPRRGQAVRRVIELRLATLQKTRPGGFLVREAPAEDIRQLRILAGHLQEGQFLTKLRKTFTRSEMDDDLLVVPAKVGRATDESEYQEILPSSPP